MSNIFEQVDEETFSNFEYIKRALKKIIENQEGNHAFDKYTKEKLKEVINYIEDIRSQDAPEIVFDDTDHFKLICPYCEGTMFIERVETRQTGTPGLRNVETYIRGYCPGCETHKYRKITWIPSDKRR